MKTKYFKIMIVFLFFGFCILSLKVEAQLWEAIPPYNLLWPLWSPVLSPLNPVTGEPTPLVNYLGPNTLLPVQPAFVWNPDLPYFTMLYNSVPYYAGSTADPTLYYFDPTEASLLTSYYTSTAFKTWPPSYLDRTIEISPGIFITGPVAINLAPGYETLLSFNPITWLNYSIPLLNYLWQDLYGVDPYLLIAANLYPADWIYQATYTPPPPVI